jgi:hypothetical protein
MSSRLLEYGKARANAARSIVSIDGVCAVRTAPARDEQIGACGAVSGNALLAYRQSYDRTTPV